MPDPDRLINTLYKATEATRQTPGRKGRFVQLQDCREVVVAGDMHGHVGNFQAIYKFADLAKNPQRHLVLQEVIHGKFFYPNGGDKSHQLLDLYAALKCQFPGQVHLLMGNHELCQWTNRMVMKEDRDLNVMFMDGVITAYASKADDIYKGYMRLFGVLPMALRTSNRVFLSHSMPRSKHLNTFELRLLETDVFPPQDLTVGGAVYELLWGRETKADHCEAFLKKVDSDYLVSGHISCPEGFAKPNPRQIIIDCCDHPAYYCVIPADRPITQQEFANTLRQVQV